MKTLELIGLHAGCILHTNVNTDVRVVKEEGYDAIEILAPKLERYLNAGYDVAELVAALGSIRVNMINRLASIDCQESASKRELYDDCQRLCKIAQDLECENLQVVALNAFSDLPWADIRSSAVRVLRDLADIAKPFGVRLGFEPVVFSPFRSLESVIEIIDATERENIGIVVDTFHHWAAGDPWDKISKLDPGFISSVHISDATEMAESEWRDDDRDVLPGDGTIPLEDGIAAVRDTGYDGVWAVEMMGASHWEWDPNLLAREIKRRVVSLLAR